MDKVREESLPLQMVKDIFTLSVKASEVLAICPEKEGCRLFKKNIQECVILKSNRTENYPYMPAEEYGEFAASPTKCAYYAEGKDTSCKVLKMMYHTRNTIRADIIRYAEFPTFRFPEIYDVIDKFYLAYIKDFNPHYESVKDSHLMFFNDLAALPSKFYEIYTADKLFCQEVRNYFDESYAQHKEQNKTKAVEGFGFIPSKVIFERFNKMMSSQHKD